jgi:VIT1/CCC1 family predicted Fe2+/Mn2+ transporter
MISSLTSFLQSSGIAPAPACIVAVLSFLVIVGLVAGVYQEVKPRKAARGRRR